MTPHNSRDKKVQMPKKASCISIRMTRVERSIIITVSMDFKTVINKPSCFATESIDGHRNYGNCNG